MKNEIKPIGNKILCKKLEEKEISQSGMMTLTSSHGNLRYEIVALPNPTINPWIKEMKVGDIVICKEFDADCIRHEEQEYYIIDVEPENGSRAGQCHAVIKK